MSGPPPPNEPPGDGDHEDDGHQPPPPSGDKLDAPRPSLIGGPDIRNVFDHATSRWGLGQFLVLMVLYQAVSIALSLLYIAWTDDTSLGFGSPNVNAWYLLLIIFAGPLVALAYVPRVARRLGNGVRADFHARFEHSDILIGVLAAVLGVFLGGIAAVFQETLGYRASDAAAVDVARDSLTDGGGVSVPLILFAVGAATLVPVAEELTFRGLFWSALEKRGMDGRHILVITSVVFAVWHLEPGRILPLIGVSLALGLARLRTGRIAAPLITHMLINAVGMLALVTEIAGT